MGLIPSFDDKGAWVKEILRPHILVLLEAPEVKYMAYGMKQPAERFSMIFNDREFKDLCVRVCV